MRMVILSILGMYNYDDSLFNNMIKYLPSPEKVPRTYEIVEPVPINSDTLIGNLLAECAELECVYADADYLKWFIGKWAEKQSLVWQNLYNSLWYKYNPIWNKDGSVEQNEKTQENYTEKNNENKNININSENNTTENVNSELNGTENGTYTNDHKVSGYNGGLETAYTDTTTQTNTSATSGTGSKTNKSSIDSTNSMVTDGNKTNNGNKEVTHITKEFGNIGVTTTQKMIAEERETALFNIYDFIINDFKNRFCLLIY